MRLLVIALLLAVGAACTAVDARSEKMLASDGGTWTATTFLYVDRFAPLSPSDFELFEEQDYAGTEFFFDEAEGTTAAYSSNFYKKGEVRLLDGHVVPFDWIFSSDVNGERNEFWMLLYEDVGSMHGGEWAVIPDVLEEDRVEFGFYEHASPHEFLVDLVLERDP